MKKLILLIVLSLICISCQKQEETSSSVNASKPKLKTKKVEAGYTSKPFSVKEEMVLIKSGKYIPLYGKGKNPIAVNDFMMDVYPVTNEQYLAFVKSNPGWQKSNIKKIFADENYLSTWENDTVLGQNLSPKSPVTNVSWFAATAYCKSLGKRLATVDEWECVAMADQTDADARKKKNFNQFILSWYEKNQTYKNEIGKTYKNYWGVYDIHGLVWEWTSDFNSILMSGENRSGSDQDKNLFCGSGSLSANDLMNYAAFMRYAFRGSLKGNYSVQNLGFRGVKDIQNEKDNSTK